jgi:hypothetical protein
MNLCDAGCRARFMIRDRGGKCPQLLDIVLRDAGIEVVLSGAWMPRVNSNMERWVQTCRRELLDRTLIWNQRRLLHALREFEDFYDGHRPHQGIANARPLNPLPPSITDPDQIARPEHTRTPTPRRHPPRVPTCRLNCVDGGLGRDNGRRHRHQVVTSLIPGWGAVRGRATQGWDGYVAGVCLVALPGPSVSSTSPGLRETPQVLQVKRGVSIPSQPRCVVRRGGPSGAW